VLLRKIRVSLTFVLLCAALPAAYAQQPTRNVPNKPTPSPTTAAATKGLRKDTFVSTDTFALPVNANVKYSKDSLDAVVDYGASDSMRFELAKNLVHLYGKAYVKYKQLSLTDAAYIVINLKDNIATAEGLPDTAQVLRGLPKFSDGNQNFTAKKMRYNFKTRKGLVYDVSSEYNAGSSKMYVHGGTSKFVSAPTDRKDSTQNDIAYSSDAIFTTCDDPHPHFGVHSFKQKLVANKMIIVGPSNLTIGDVPTPLWLPFGFFPLTKGRHTGLIFPRDYEVSDRLGFGLRNVGYYFPINEHRDLQLTGDIYWNGTFGLNALSNYNTNYRSNGSFSLGYRRENTESSKFEPLVSTSFLVRWSHTQSAKANPFYTFSSNVNFETGGYSQRNYNDYARTTRGTVQSNINFTRNFPGKPYTLTANASIGQNLAAKSISFSLPNADFQLQRIFPFQRKKRVGEEAWYEKISFTYNSRLQNSFVGNDSTFNSGDSIAQMFRNAQFGISHTMTTDVQLRVFKYFNLTPSVGYSEYWYLKQLKKRFDPTKTVRLDTVYNADGTSRQIVERVLSYGTLRDSLEDGFYRVSNLQNVSVSLSTASPLFGKLVFSQKGRIRALRHTITPSVSFGYTPDHSEYVDSINTLDSRGFYQRLGYNRFERGVYGAPSGQRSMGIGYSFTNLFELKTFSKKDSTEKKIRLLDNINVSGGYNFLAVDSFYWSPLNMSTGTNFFNGLINVSMNATASFYQADAKGKQIRAINDVLFRLTDANITAYTSFGIQQIRDLLKPKTTGNPTPQKVDNRRNSQKFDTDQDFTDLFNSFRLSWGVTYTRQRRDGVDTSQLVIGPLSVSGDIPLTQNLKLTVGNIGYDFVTQKMTYPDLGFYRDLHCWEAGMNWQPQRGTFTFFLRVKPGTLDFIKVPYNKNILDAQR
jgi:hypothetical protein